MGPFLLYLSLALVLMWTLRVARVKARNPWVWGGMALALMALSDPWRLPSMVPMMVLLFLKSPRPTSGPGPEGATCPRCRASHPHGRYYCTNCGWELTKPYSGDIAVPEEKTATSTLPESSEPMTAPNAAAPVEELESALSPEGRAVSEESSTAAAKPQQEAPAEGEANSPRQVSRGIPTPANMTERGLGLFSQGRLQESIDQFTKAIALDPNYTPALEGRAEAHARLGRGEQAAEDRRRLKALRAS